MKIAVRPLSHIDSAQSGAQVIISVVFPGAELGDRVSVRRNGFSD